MSKRLPPTVSHDRQSERALAHDSDAGEKLGQGSGDRQKESAHQRFGYPRLDELRFKWSSPVETLQSQ